MKLAIKYHGVQGRTIISLVGTYVRKSAHSQRIHSTLICSGVSVLLGDPYFSSATLGTAHGFETLDRLLRARSRTQMRFSSQKPATKLHNWISPILPLQACSKRGLQAYGGGSISRDCAVRFSLVIHRSQRLQLEPNCIVHRHSILPR